MRSTLKVAVFSAILLTGLATASLAAEEITQIETPPPPIDMKLINEVWQLVQNLTGRKDIPPPPIVIDWDVPLPYGGGFQFPTSSNPQTRVQISIAPRTIDINERTTHGWFYYSIGHELLHYMSWKMGYAIDEQDPTHGSHHCLPEFQKNAEKILELLEARIYSPSLRLRGVGQFAAQCNQEGDRR